jgi:hypothetical protein
MVAASELSINQNASALQMAQTIFGEGVTVVNASYSGDRNSSGIYTGGDATSPGVVPGDDGVILSTGRVRDFTNNNGDANQENNTSTNTRGPNNEPDFNAAAGTSTFDASFLDIDFVPDSNFMTMQFVFSSEEYPEFQNSVYQDFVGVWVNGTQVDLVVGNGDADPGNVNSTNNENLFVDNTSSQFNTEMDGFTVTMTLTMPVNTGVVNSIRIGVADVVDSSYDSNLLIAGNSVQTDLVAFADSATIYPNGTANLDVLSNDINNGAGALTITHINGQSVAAGSVITLNTGQTVTLLADGTFDIVGDGDIEDFNFTYSVSNGANSDVGFVNVSSIPCFVAGTLIRTPDGECPVENLRPGDLVMTRDEGACPVRWAGSRRVEAEGDFAPIHIRANTFGTHRDLKVSPQHRILVQDSLAQLLFGEDEVLVAAKEFLNDHSVRRKCGGTVIYVHLMFDKHQVIYSEDLPTESFLPGPQTTECFEQPLIDEICQIFPELDPKTGEGYGTAARRTLRQFEANLLLSRKKAA